MTGGEAFGAGGGGGGGGALLCGGLSILYLHGNYLEIFDLVMKYQNLPEEECVRFRL